MPVIFEVFPSRICSETHLYSHLFPHLLFAGFFEFERRRPRTRRAHEPKISQLSYSGSFDIIEKDRRLRRQRSSLPIMWLPNSARDHASSVSKRGPTSQCKSGNIWVCQPGIVYTVACSIIIGCALLYWVYLQFRPRKVSCLPTEASRRALEIRSY